MAKKKKSSAFSKFLLFLVFLAIGVGGGYYIAKTYLLNKDDDTPIATEIGDKDITNNKEFSDTIDELYKFLQENVYLYNTNGMNPSSIDNNIKLNIAYKYVVDNKMYTEGTIERISTLNCEYNFLIDSVQNEDGTSTNQDYCKVNYISKDVLNKALDSIFKAGTVELINEYRPNNNTLCYVQDSGNYICGKVVGNEESSDGEVVSKFEIVKVTIDDNNTITIYDKGYLLDNRSDVEKVGDYKNAYLHSYDASEHYYELKSSDNLTFKHVFNNIDNKYYYVSSELYK